MARIEKTLQLIEAKGGIDNAISFCQDQITIYEEGGFLTSVIVMWEGHLINLLKMKENA